MSPTQIDVMLKELLEQIDYDIAKDYDVETAEEPELVEEAMYALRGIVLRHLIKASQ